MLNVLKRSEARKKKAQALEAVLTARARAPVFFTDFGVPDTIDGRFDLLVLHAWLVFDRLKGEEMRPLSQTLMDSLFSGFDEGLRDLGAGDIGMGRRMKKMADALYGRFAAYEAAADEAAMAAALQRNVYRGDANRADETRILAHYVTTARQAVESCDLAAGQLAFGPLPQR